MRTAHGLRSGERDCDLARAPPGKERSAGRDGTGITLVLPEQQSEVSHVARGLGEQDQFEQQGMRVAPKRLVYSGRGRRSKWGPTRQRRKI